MAYSRVRAVQALEQLKGETVSRRASATEGGARLLRLATLLYVGKKRTFAYCDEDEAREELVLALRVYCNADATAAANGSDSDDVAAQRLAPKHAAASH